MVIEKKGCRENNKGGMTTSSLPKYLPDFPHFILFINEMNTGRYIIND